MSKVPPSLVHLSEGPDDTETLQSLLARIHDERGHFRHITEESLQAEIASQNVDESSSDTDDEMQTAEVEEVDSKSRREQLFAAKAEMLPHVASAQNEALTALDFVSLLLSKDAPKQAELTMSPYLKQHLKPGILGMDAWQNMQVDTEQERIDDAAARGWRMQSLQASADSLLGAATRLEKIVKRETTYWEQVLSVSEKGWSVSRMPRERHNLGVRFGFLEALGEFRDRGLSALRADASGNVVLAKALGHDSRVIRIRIRQGDKTVGTSQIPRIAEDSEMTLEARIRHARDSLYEEELFQEIIRESRTLASYGVDMRESTIFLPTRFDTSAGHAQVVNNGVFIDLVPFDEEDKDSSDSTSQNHWAQAIGLVFRLLLSCTHRERLERRSELPLPLSVTKGETPIARILRPVLTLLQHRSTLDDVARYLEELRLVLSDAAIGVSTKPATIDSSILDDADSMDALMKRIATSLHSQCSLVLNLPDGGEPLEFRVLVDTGLSAPTFGSRMTAISPTCVQRAEVHDMEELIEHMNACVASGLGRGIVTRSPGWKLDERSATLTSRSNVRKISVALHSEDADSSGDERKNRLILFANSKKMEWRGRSGSPKTDRGFWESVDALREAKEDDSSQVKSEMGP